MTNAFIILGQTQNGAPIRIGATDTGTTDQQGNPIYSLAVDSVVSIDPGDITIAAVKVQDAGTATEAKVAAATAIAVGNNALAVHDPQVGQIGDVLGDGSVIGLLDALAPAVSLGVSGAAFHSANQSGSAAAVTDAPSTGLNLVITDLVVSAGAAMVVTFTEETSGTVLLKLDMAANSTVVFTPRGRFTLPTADKKLMVQTSASGTIDVMAQYYSA